MSAIIPAVRGALPLLGNMGALLVGSPWDVTEGWLREYGPVASFAVPGARWLVTKDLSLIRHVLTQGADHYVKETSSMAPFHDLLGGGLLSSDHELWRRHRAILGRAFRVDALRGVPAITERAAARLFRRWEAAARAGEAVDVGEGFRALTLEVIAAACLGMSAAESDAILPRLYEPLVAECNKRVWHPYRALLPIPARARYRAGLRELDALLVDKIAARRRRGPPPEDGDMLDMLLGGLRELPWSRALEGLICDELKTMLFAGHDTSSAMLTWTVHALSRAPELLAQVRAEADAVTPGGALPEYEALRGLDLAQACLKEALRIYNVVPVVTREAARDDQVGGWSIPRGTKIMLHLQAVHRDPENWADPGRFDPSRFREKSPGYRWIPFVTGPRSCVGQHFSLLEAKLVLALLVQRFDLEAAPGNSDLRHRYQAPITPRAPIRALLRRRA
jgi:beta-ring hydroxylase